MIDKNQTMQELLMQRAGQNQNLRDSLIKTAMKQRESSDVQRPIAQAIDFFTGISPEERKTNLAPNYPTEYQNQAVGAQLANTTKDDALGALSKYSAQLDKQNKATETGYRNMFGDFTRDNSIKTLLEEQASFKRANTLADLNNPVTASIFKRSMIRLSGERGGRFSDQDVKQFGGSQALADRINQVMEDVMTGKFTEDNIGYYKELMGVMKNMNDADLSRKIDGFANIAPHAYGVPSSTAKNVLFQRIGMTEDMLGKSQQQNAPAKEAAPAKVDDAKAAKIEALKKKLAGN